LPHIDPPIYQKWQLTLGKNRRFASMS